jgi:PKD domain
VSARRAKPTVACVALAAAIACAWMLAAAPARAVIETAVTIDGPSQEIVSFGGVAMAEDGTGGLVYLKKVGGVPHVFVSRYVEGRWQAPIRVDGGQRFAASWPRIGAANGGELIVVWATPFATEIGGEGTERPVQELLGATLAPGSSSFGEAGIVDPDIGNGIGTSPSLSVNTTGQADVVYRVVENNAANQVPALRPGDVTEQVRIARYTGFRWTQLGAVNRNQGISMRSPTSANAPQIAINALDNGIVVWQEPEINGVARIWARRVFGSAVNYVMPVTATSLHGVAIGADADAPATAILLTGQAVVAYRQAYGPGSPLGGPRIFLNTLPDGESDNGLEFAGAGVADTSVPGGAGAKIGPPSIDLDEHREVRLLYDAGGTARVVEGDDKGLLTAATLGPPFAGSEAPAASVVNPAGGGVSAWASHTPAGAPAVAVREDFPDKAVQTALVAGGNGGPIGELAVGRSALGDGLIAFQQGATGDAAIVAAQATAPPAELLLTVPKGFVKPSQALIAWQAPISANGPLVYHLVFDGRVLGAVAPGRLSARIASRLLANGTHQVQLMASDRWGQTTLSAPAPLQIDGTPPNVKLARAGALAVVRISALSGVARRFVRVDFGDGHRASGRTIFRHRYARAGVYTIVARVRDRIGNAGVVRRKVRVP